jgi:Flp pilus assembly protein CpaB
MKKIYMIAILAILGLSAALAQENAEAINKRAEAMLNRKPSEALILAEQAKLLAETEQDVFC